MSTNEQLAAALEDALAIFGPEPGAPPMAPKWAKRAEEALAAYRATPPQAEAPCGHPASLTLKSAETGEPLYCELCDDKSGRRDAEQREQELASAEPLTFSHIHALQEVLAMGYTLEGDNIRPPECGVPVSQSEYQSVLARALKAEAMAREIIAEHGSATSGALRAEAAQPAGEPVAWQDEPGGSSFVSHRTRKTNQAFQKLYTVPLYTPPPQVQRAGLTAAARDVLAERHRQMAVEGWSAEHDDEHDAAEMARAAACYAMSAADIRFEWPLDTLWPWERGWWKPHEPRRNLVKAGALILAEIERLDRARTGISPAGADTKGMT